MKFTAVLLALPALSLAQTFTTSPIPPPPVSTPDPAICEEIAGGYARFCERCAPRCYYQVGSPEIYRQCLQSTFMIINAYDSECWQHGGWNCADQAVNKVCGPQ